MFGWHDVADAAVANMDDGLAVGDLAVKVDLCCAGMFSRIHKRFPRRCQRHFECWSDESVVANDIHDADLPTEIFDLVPVSEQASFETVRMRRTELLDGPAEFALLASSEVSHLVGVVSVNPDGVKSLQNGVMKMVCQPGTLLVPSSLFLLPGEGALGCKPEILSPAQSVKGPPDDQGECDELKCACGAASRKTVEKV
jgi:hypothetical protein